MNPKKQAIRLVSRIAAENGYRVIPEWDLADYPLIQHLKELFALYRIDCVLDVGANIGQYAEMLRDKVGYRGLILSFEPVAALAEELAQHAKDDPQWKVFPFALGSTVGTAEINVTKAPKRNSLLAPRTDIVTDFWSSDAVAGVETITVRTVDEFMRSEGIDCAARRVYLKIDTQGFDLEVAKGAKASLASIQAMQMEASIRAIYQGMPNYLESIAHMDAAGYDISGLFKIESDESLRLLEFDCVMVNRRFADVAAAAAAAAGAAQSGS